MASTSPSGADPAAGSAVSTAPAGPVQAARNGRAAPLTIVKLPPATIKLPTWATDVTWVPKPPGGGGGPVKFGVPAKGTTVAIVPGVSIGGFAGGVQATAPTAMTAPAAVSAAIR